MGAPISINRANTTMQTGNNSNLHPLFAIRLASGFLSSTVQLNTFSIICTSSSAYEYFWILDPTITGTALSFTALANSSIEFDASRTSSTSVTAGTGTVINSGVGFQSNNGGTTVGFFRDEFALGSDISGTSQILVLAIRRVTGANERFYGGVNLTDQK